MSHIRMTKEEYEARTYKPKLPDAAWPPKESPKKAKAVPARSQLETKFEHQLILSGLPMPIAEFYPFAERKHRIDFAYPTQRIAIEIDGAPHRIKERFLSDLEKHGLLVVAGWRLIRIGRAQVESGQGIEWIKSLLEATA